MKKICLALLLLGVIATKGGVWAMSFPTNGETLYVYVMNENGDGSNRTYIGGDNNVQSDNWWAAANSVPSGTNEGAGFNVCGSPASFMYKVIDSNGTEYTVADNSDEADYTMPESDGGARTFCQKFDAGILGSINIVAVKVYAKKIGSGANLKVYLKTASETTATYFGRIYASNISSTGFSWHKAEDLYLYVLNADGTDTDRTEIGGDDNNNTNNWWKGANSAPSGYNEGTSFNVCGSPGCWMMKAVDRDSNIFQSGDTSPEANYSCPGEPWFGGGARTFAQCFGGMGNLSVIGAQIYCRKVGAGADLKVYFKRASEYDATYIGTISASSLSDTFQWMPVALDDLYIYILNRNGDANSRTFVGKDNVVINQWWKGANSVPSGTGVGTGFSVCGDNGNYMIELYDTKGNFYPSGSGTRAGEYSLPESDSSPRTFAQKFIGMGNLDLALARVYVRRLGAGSDLDVYMKKGLDTAAIYVGTIYANTLADTEYHWRTANTSPLVISNSYFTVKADPVNGAMTEFLRTNDSYGTNFAGSEATIPNIGSKQIQPLGDVSTRYWNGSMWKGVYGEYSSPYTPKDVSLDSGVITVRPASESCPYKIEERYSLSDTEQSFIWEVQVTNTSAQQVEIGELALPMTFNSNYNGFVYDPASQKIMYEKRVYVHKFISGHSSYILVQRLNGKGPYLLLMPEDNTLFEFATMSSRGNSGDSGFSYEGSAKVFLLSKGTMSANGWSDWFNGHTSAVLSSGETRTFRIKGFWVNSYADAQDRLYSEGKVSAKVIPGMVIPRDVAAKVLLKCSKAITGVTGDTGATVQLISAGGGTYKYAISFGRSGSHIVKVSYGESEWTNLMFYSTESMESVIKARANFIASNQLYINAAETRDHALICWDSRPAYGVPYGGIITDQWWGVSGGSYEYSNGEAMTLAEKLANYPDTAQLAVMNSCETQFLSSDLHIYDAGNDVYDVRGSCYPGDPAWVGRPWDYTHNANIYYALYRVAKSYPGKLSQNWSYYLTRSYKIAKGMYTIDTRGKGRVPGFSELDLGFMNASNLINLLGALKDEGMDTEYNALRGYVLNRANFFSSAEYPLGSEIPYDNTGYENIYSFRKYLEDSGTVPAYNRLPIIDVIKACKGHQPFWFWYESDLRWWDGGDAAETCLHYMAGVNAWPLLDEFEKSGDYESLMMGYGGMLGIWAKVEDSDIETNGAVGIYMNGVKRKAGIAHLAYNWDPATNWEGNNFHFHNGGDIGVALEAYLARIKSYLAADPDWGIVGFGCDASDNGTEYLMTPRDGLYKKAYFAPLKLDIKILENKISDIAVRKNMSRIFMNVTKISGTGSTTTLCVNGLGSGLYQVKVSGSIFGNFSEIAMKKVAGIPVSGSSTTTIEIIPAAINETASHITLGPARTRADSAAFCCAVVTLNDTRGSPVSGKQVLLKAARGNSTTIRDSAGGAANPQTTNASGQCTFLVRSGYVGMETITAVCGGLTVTMGVSSDRAAGIWHMDDISGDTVYDASGSGANGKVCGPAWVSAPNSAAFGSALLFDGTNDYADLPDGFADFSQGISIELRARPAALKAWARFIDFGNGPGSNNIIFARYGGSDSLVFQIWAGGTSGGQVVAASAIELNKWQYFAVTEDSLGNVRIYKNGALAQSGTTAVPVNITRTSNYIGRSNWGADDYYEGIVDEVRIYGRVLSDTEIKASFNKKANTYFYSILASKLKIVTPAYSVPQNCISPVIFVEAQDEAGDRDANFNNTVTLSTSSSSGSFSVSNTTWINTTVITFKNGLGSFYYRDSAVGNPVLTADHWPLTTDTQTEIIYVSDWVWMNNVSSESGAIHTSASGSWNRDGFRTKRDYIVPRDGLEVEYAFRAIKGGVDSQMFESRIGGAEYHRFLFCVNGQYCQVYTKDTGDPNWVFRAASPNTITLGTWYYVKVKIRRNSFDVIIKERDTGNTFWDPAAYPTEISSAVGFLLGDAEANRGDAETWWDDVRVWSFQRDLGPAEDDAGVWSLTGNASISGGQFHTTASGSWNHDGVQTKYNYFIPPNGLRVKFSFKPVVIGQDSQMMESRLDGAYTQDFVFFLNSGPCTIYTKQGGGWAPRAGGPVLSAGTWYDVDTLISTGSFQVIVYDRSTGTLLWDSGYVWKDTSTITGFLFGDCEATAGTGQTDWDNVKISGVNYVLPEPKEARYCPFENRGFKINAGTKIVLSSSASADDLFAAGLLRDDIQSYFGITVSVTQGFSLDSQSNCILAGIPSQDANFGSICVRKGIDADTGIGDEGYILEIIEDANSAIIAARGSAGLFYGVVTMRQLLDKSRADTCVTAAKVRDHPSVKYRGIMHDIARGQILTLDYMEEMLKVLSYYKINIFSPYIEHTFYFQSHPDIGAGWGPVTAAQMQSLSSLGKQYRVEVFPSFQSLGHQYWILSIPAYNGYAEVPSAPWSFGVLAPGVYDFFGELYSEVCPAFNQSTLFNICCDEVYDLGAGVSKPLADAVGKGGVLATHVINVRNILKGTYGRDLSMWGDVVLSHPTVLTDTPMIPADVVFLNWEYNCADSLEDRVEYTSIDVFADAGRKQWVCPGSSGWLRIFPNFRRGNKNVKSFIKDGLNHAGVEGLLDTNWNDENDHLTSLNYYNFVYAGECGWSVDTITLTYNESEELFRKKYSYQFYGSRSDDLAWAIRQLSETDYVIHDLTTYGQAGQNASWNYWLFWDDPFWGNYSRDIPNPASKASAMRSLADSALAILGDYRPITLYNAATLDPIINAGSRIRYLAQRIGDVEQIISVYATACDYADDTSFADAAFNSINTIITNDLKAPVAGMKSAFESLWLSENSRPLLDNRLATYDWLGGRYDHTLLRLKHNKERYIRKRLLDPEFFNLPETRNAQFLSNTIPDTMYAGCQYFAQVTVLNNGNLEWTDTEAYKLGAVGDADPFTFNRQLLSKDDIIWRNETKTFIIKMTAPETPGIYLTDWKMLEEGVAWFGGEFARNVTVLDTQGPNYFCSYIKVNTPVLSANGASTTTVMAEIKTNTGIPVAGETLSLVLENPILRTVNPVSAVSDGNGQATFTISSYYAGSEMISAVYGGVYAILENIVANPSFETGTGNDASAWVEGTNHIRSSDRLYSGNYSLRSTYTGSDTSTRIFLAKIIPGSAYKLSGRIFNSFLSSGQAYFDMNDRPAPGSDCALYSTRGKNAWELLQGTWYSGTDTTAVVRCVTDGSPDGTAWFDCVRLERIPTMSFISTRLKITSIQQTIYVNTPSLPVTVEARGNSGGTDVTFNNSITLLASSPSGKFSVNGAAWQDTTNIYLSSGQGTFYYRDANAGRAIITVTRYSLLVDTQVITTVQNLSYFILNPAVVQAGGVSKCTVTVSMKSDTGGLVTGRTVTLYTSRGNSDTIQPASQLTDLNGQCTFTISSTYAGDAVVKAVCDSITIANTMLDYFSSSSTWTVQAGTWLIESNEYSGDANGAGIAETPFTFPGGTVYVRMRMQNGYGGTTSSHMIFYEDPNNYLEWALYNNDSIWVPNRYIIKQVVGGIPYISIQAAGETVLYDKLYEVRIEVTQEKVRWWLNTRLVAEWLRPSGSAVIYSKLQLGTEYAHIHYDDLKIGAVNFSPSGTRLKFVTSAFSVNQFKPSSPVTVEAQDTGGNKDLLFSNTVTLFSSSAQGKFSASDDPWSDTTTVRFSAGAGIFFYKDSVAGNPIITVTRYSLLVDTQTETITTAVASSTISYLVLNPPIVSTGARCTVTVSVKSDIGAALSGRTVSLYTNRGNTDTILTNPQVTDSNGQATFTISSVSAGNAAVKAICDSKTISDTLIENFASAAAWASLAGTWQVENNEYSGDMNGTGMSETPLEFSGGTLYVRLKMVNGYGGISAPHLIFYSSAGSFLEWSMRNNDSASNPNYFEIRQKTGGTIYSVEQQVGEAITYNKWYEVRIEVTQAKIRWWLNNNFIAEWARPSGSPAVYSKFRLKTEDSHVHFDDIKIDAVNFSAAATKLKIITPSFISSQYAPSPSVTVEAQDNTGNKALLFNNTVTLLSSSAQGKFSVNISPWSDTTNIYLSSGAGMYYYRDGNVGNPRITAYRVSLTADTQTETITAAVAGETASYITFYPYLVPADNSSRCTVVVTVNENYFGIPLPGKLVTLQTARGNSDTIRDSVSGTVNPQTTNAGGQCTFTVFSAYAGLDTITASCGGKTLARGTDRYGAVGIWHLDSNANDLSGNGNNGSLTGNPEWASFPGAVFGSAMKLAGTGDYADCGNGSSLRIANAITIEVWANLVPDPAWSKGWMMVAGKRYPFDDAPWALRQGGNAVYVVINPKGGSNYLTMQVDGIADRAWHHIVATYDGNYGRTYIDNSLRATSVLSSFTIDTAPAEHLFLGGWQMQGMLDEARVYNRALSAEEISASYSRRANMYFTASRLKFTTPARATTAGNPTAEIIIQAQDGYGNKDVTNNSTVTLQVSGTGYFSIDRQNWVNTTSVALAGGEAAFYYKSPNTGAFIITASRVSFTADTQTETVVAPGVNANASYIYFNPHQVSADNGSSPITAIVFIADTYGFPIAAKTVTLTASRGNSVTIQPASQPTGSNGMCTFTVYSGYAGQDTVCAKCDGNTVFENVMMTANNPSFELGSGTAASGWNMAVNQFRDPLRAHSGSFSIMCKTGGPSSSITQASVPVLQNSNYLFSAWFWSQHTAGSCYIDFADVTGDPNLTCTPNLQAWEYRSIIWNSTSYTGVVQRVVTDGGFSGTCWVDDMMIRRCPTLTFTGTKLSFVSPSFRIRAGDTSPQVAAASSGNSGGADEMFNDTVSLSTSSNSGSFSVSNVLWQDTSSITFNSGAGAFYYRDYAVGYPVLSAMSYELSANTQTETISITALQITNTPGFTITSISTAPIMVRARDGLGNIAVNSTDSVTLQSSSLKGKFSLSGTLWSDTTSVYLSAGSVVIYYKDKKGGNPIVTVSRIDSWTFQDTQQETVTKPIVLTSKVQMNMRSGEIGSMPMRFWINDTVEYIIYIQNTGTETATGNIVVDTRSFDTSANNAVDYVYMDTAGYADTWAYTTDPTFTVWATGNPLSGASNIKGLRWTINSLGINSNKALRFRVRVK